MKVRIIKDKKYSCFNIEIKRWWMPFWWEVAHTFGPLEEAIEKAQRNLNYPEVVWEGESNV